MTTDLLIITVNEYETQAVIEAFRESTGQQAKAITIDRKVYRHLGAINGVQVTHARSEMGSGGLGAAHQTVMKSIAALKPKAVVAVGIAFGIDNKKQDIGDILISKQLFLYEPQRVGNTTKFRGDRPHASSWLIDFFEGFAHASWRGEARVRSGLILSGEKLIDHEEFRSALLKAEPEAVGGEMEGAGLYTASHEEKVDWIVIKAICDWADGNKDEDKETRQRFAAKNAAVFVVEALKEVALIDSNLGRTGDPSNVLGRAKPAKAQIRKQFTEADRDRFLEDSFEKIAAFFDVTLKDLALEHTEFEVGFRRVDANRFTAVIYRNGKAVARCKIVLGGGGFSHQITYSGNDRLEDTGINDSLDVKAKDGEMYLKPWGLASWSSDKPNKLNPEEAAAYFWSVFVRTLQ